MLRALGDALASSIGRKAVLGVTGLLLVGFLATHLFGNQFLYHDADGEAFDGYVQSLKDWGPLLTVAELGLAALFLCHVYLAFRLTLENREARRERYVVRATRGGATPASLSMFATGALILAFLVKHLIDFRFDAGFHEDPAGTVDATLSSPVHAVVYLVGAVLVGVHVSHGLRSALQSIGVNHPAWNPLIEKASIGVAALVALGFASFPIYYLFLKSSGATP